VISTTGQTAQGVAVINAWRLREQRKAELQSATNVYNQAAGTKEAKCQPYTLLERKFSLSPASFVTKLEIFDGEFLLPFGAQFNGVPVPLSEEYRQGRQIISDGTLTFYEIERWGFDAAGCATADADLTTASGQLATAQSNLSNAELALTAAMAALPVNDPLRLSDVCGKRVSSCALHFPEQSLPFGGFPGANVVRS
jgi:hypothetical protein